MEIIPETTKKIMTAGTIIQKIAVFRKKKNKTKKLEAHKNMMKCFETMNNTADSNPAKELVADNAAFYTPASLDQL